MREPDLGDRLRELQRPLADRERVEKLRNLNAVADEIAAAIELELLEWASQSSTPSREVELTGRPWYVRASMSDSDFDPMHKFIVRALMGRGVKADWYERDQFEMITVSWRKSTRTG